jgi:hypothetical protein
MTEQHVLDDRLIELCVSNGTPSPDEHAHLAACAKCGLRRASIVEILADVEEAATVAADAAFPPARLDRQQARILQRIDQDGRPGRLISFPASQSPATLMRSRSHVRWAAAAAAAAFVFGLIAGHFVTDLPIGTQARSAGMVAKETRPNVLRAVPTTFSEDEFLGEIEFAASSHGPLALRPLDAMTPRAWEVR